MAVYMLSELRPMRIYRHNQARLAILFLQGIEKVQGSFFELAKR